MSQTHNSTTQFELFPEGGKNTYQAPVGRSNPRQIVLSTEHLIGSCIILIVAGVVCFCLGVQQGQKRVQAAGLAMKNIADISDENAIIVRSDEPKVEVLEIPPVVEESIPEVAELPEEKIEILDIELPPEVPEFSGYTIQVASFKKEASAKKEAMNLQKKGFETSIMQKGQHSIVCVGKFSDRQDAKKFSKRLKDKYKDFIVRRL